MTICIAAISENSKVLAVTDKMLTLERPISTTFEITDNNKVAKLNNKTFALFAGDVTQANEILKKAQLKLATATKPTVYDAASLVNEAFADHWENVVSSYLYMRYRLRLEDFTKNQGSFDPDLIKQINDLISKFTINVEIIVAGIDEKPRIYTVDNAGSVIEHTTIGYAGIGSGQIHATLSLIESEYSTSFNKAKALYTLLEAKKRAEYDPGVGEYTDIAIVDNRFQQYNATKVKEILQIFSESKSKIKVEKEKHYKRIEELPYV